MNSPLIYLTSPCLIDGHWHDEVYEFYDVGHDRAIELDRRHKGLAVAKVPFYSEMYRTYPNLEEHIVFILRDFLEGVLELPAEWQDDEWKRLTSYISVEPEPVKPSKKKKNAAAK